MALPEVRAGQNAKAEARLNGMIAQFDSGSGLE
jgi:hypothetical protein